MNWLNLFSKKQSVTVDATIGDDKLFNALMKLIGQDPVWIADNFDEYINKGYLLNDNLYSIIRWITKQSSAVPWVMTEIKSQKELKRYLAYCKSGEDNFVQAMKYRSKALKEVDDHDVLRVLHHPNPLQGGTEFMENVIGFKLLLGNSYIHGIAPDMGPNKGKFKELYVLPAHLTKIIAGNSEHPIKEYIIQGDQEVRFPEPEVCHLRYWTADYSSRGSHLYGLSPLRAASRIVRVDNDSTTAMAKLTQNLGLIGMFVQNSDKMGNSIDEDGARRLEEKFWRKMRKNDGRPIFTSGNFKWEQAGMSPVDLALLQQGTFNLRRLCNVYGMNSAIFNDPENKTFNNMKEARKSAIINAVLPELNDVRDELNRWLVPSYNEGNSTMFLDYDVKAIPEMQEDLEKLVSNAKSMHWITPNEQRAMTGFDEDTTNPMMNEFHFPSTLVPLGSAIETGDDIKTVNAALETAGVKDYE